MLKRLLLGLIAIIVVAVVVVLFLALRQPDEFRVQRTATINAPAEKIVPHIEDFHQWGAWSPYWSLDPAMALVIMPGPSGKGTMYAWVGNGEVGTGVLKMLESSPEEVVIEAHTSEPIEVHGKMVFSLQPDGNATRLVWAMDGSMGFWGKLETVYVDVDAAIGAIYEQGLADLKAVSEQ